MDNFVTVTMNYFLAYNRYLALFGIAAILGCAVLFSQKRSAIAWRTVFAGLLLHFASAFCLLWTGLGYAVLSQISAAVGSLYHFADAGSSFLFGSLVKADTQWGFIFAFKVLPVIIFFGALMGLLFHWGVIQRIVYGVSIVIRPLLGTSGAETLCAIANSMLGQTEAPLLVRHYLSSMTDSEIFVVMVSGMATISGAILTVFVAMGVPAQHLVSASFMAIPASLVMAKIMVPETKKAKTTASGTPVTFPIRTRSSVDAIATGTGEGLHLALNIGAMIIAFLSLLALINSLLASFSNGIQSSFELLSIPLSFPVLSIEYVLSRLFYPFAYLLGFTGNEALQVGNLLGVKVSLNEVMAYGKLVTLNLSQRTTAIVTYALCGFSNFSCIGIQIGGIGTLVPEKRALLNALGVRCVLASSLANLLSAMVAALLL